MSKRTRRFLTNLEKALVDPKNVRDVDERRFLSIDTEVIWMISVSPPLSFNLLANVQCLTESRVY